jgi:hypothetical protein
MFPLDFPYGVLEKHASPGEWVVDPFCGRGTTNYASRVLGLPSIGMDSSPVAVAISQAKLANTNPEAILRSAKGILKRLREPSEIPTGEFWDWAYHPTVLHTLCRLREGLLQDCRSQSRQALRGIILGALHGPRSKTVRSYFSNQSQRTYAPKPAYAVRYWKRHNLQPEPVDVLGIIKRRAERYYSRQRQATGRVIRGDSRDEALYRHIDHGIRWVITSPPYYGMRTYIPDQWLRMWFVGGSPEVEYAMEGQVEHTSPELFARQLGRVWKNVGNVCVPGAQMVIRFGGINDRAAEHLPILDDSLQGSGWAIEKIESAGSASKGRRQARHINNAAKPPREEHDVWTVWQGG